MQFIVAISLIALSLTLFAVAGSMLSRTRGSVRPGATRAQSPTERHPPPNPVFWLAGGVLMAVGVAVAVAGAGEVMDAANLPDPFHGRGARAQADAASTVVWGAVTLTIGAYIWRGAKKRGWKDRGGRLVIIAGYLLIGAAMSETLHVGVGLWSATTESEGDNVLDAVMATFLAWGAPGALLVFVGTKLAKEKILMTAGVTVDY